MKKSRLLAAVGYLVLGMWVGSSSLDGATAQSPSLTFPLKLGQTQPSTPSSTPRLDADLEATESKFFLTPVPISPACPFAPIPVSEAAANASLLPLWETFTETSTVKIEGFSRSIEQGDGGEITITTQSEGRDTVVTFVQGDGSDPDLDWTVNNLVRTGKLDEALQVARRIRDVSLKNEVLLRIVRAYKEAGQLDRATEVIDRLAAAYRTLAKPDSTAPESAVYTASTLLEIANHYATVGRTDRVAELLPEIFEIAKTLPRQNSETVGVLSGTAELYALVGQRQRAAEVLSDALQAVENIEETFVKAIALTQIADGYAQLKQPDRATELLSQVLELAKSENDVSEKNVILIILARSYGVLGQFDEAFQITNAIEPTSLRDQVKQTLDCSRKAR
jgi:tetratricopeptide (TPR) repeat protein